MNQEQINKEILVSETKAMLKYINRRTFNIFVVKEMVSQLSVTVNGMLPPTLEKAVDNHECRQ